MKDGLLKMLLHEDENVRNNVRINVVNHRSSADDHFNKISRTTETVDHYVDQLRRYFRTNGSIDSDRRQSKLTNLDNLGEVLKALKVELKTDNGFVDLFVEEPRRGLYILVDLLDIIHDEMDRLRKTENSDDQLTSPRDIHHSVKRRLAEEYHLLLCIKFSLINSDKSVEDLVKSNSQEGVTSVSRCLISRFSKCRLISLLILTRVCDAIPQGHHVVMRSMTSLRVLLCESVRFKFLVTLLNSSQGSSAGFQVACLRFINTLIDHTRRPAYRIQLQCELQDAGFKLQTIEEKLSVRDLDNCREVLRELDRWRTNYLDFDSVMKKYEELEIRNSQLKEEVHIFKKSLMKLEEDKINLMQIEKELTQMCNEKDTEIKNIKKKMEQLQTFQEVSITVKQPDDKHHLPAPPPPPSPPAPPKTHDPDDSGWRSMSSPEYETPEEIDPPDSEEVVVVAPTMMVMPPPKISNGTQTSSKTNRYYLFSSNTLPSSRSQRTVAAGKVSKPRSRSRFDEDFDSALSETDSDCRPTPWRYPAIPSPVPRHRDVGRNRASRRSDDQKSSSVKRAKSEEGKNRPLMTKHPAAVAESPDSIFRRIGSDPISLQCPTSYRNRRSNAKSTSSLIELTPLPVLIPAPDYMTDAGSVIEPLRVAQPPPPPSEVQAPKNGSKRMSIFRRTSIKFRKAFSERKKKRPDAWNVA